MKPTPILMLEFERADTLVQTLRRLARDGYSRLDVFTPYPSGEIDEALPGRRSPIGWWMLVAGIAGGVGAYALQWIAAHDYPLNVGGRPLHSWPAYVPVVFELTVLSAAVVGVLALLWFARLPRLDHAVFSDPRFLRASQDRFFLCVRTDDPRFTRVGFDRIVRESGAISIGEVAG